MPWRLRITGIESLNLSATSWASLNDFGITRWTRTSRGGRWPARRSTGRSGARARLGAARRRRRCRRSRRAGGASRGGARSGARGSGPRARPRARGGLELLVLVRVAVLGQAEVDERAVPGVAECHDGRPIRVHDAIPLHYAPYRRVPTRTIVAPSSTATA